MKLTRERRIYLAILGLGVAGVAVDRLWLGSGPAQASAAVIDQPLAEQHGPAEPAKPSRVVSVARQLEELRAAQGSENSDAFVLPVTWRPPALAATDTPATAEPGQTPAESPPRVTGLIGRGDSVAAVIDGDAVRLGHASRSGVRLVRVEKLSVTVERGGRTFVVTLDPADGLK